MSRTFNYWFVCSIGIYYFALASQDCEGSVVSYLRCTCPVGLASMF